MQTQPEIPLDELVRRRTVAIDTPNDLLIPDEVEHSEWSYPEGGKEAWGCLLGSFALMVPSFGFQAASRLP